MIWPASGGWGSEFVAETVQYRYNVRDELLEQTSSVSGLTTNAYDANGSQVRSVSSDGQ